MIVKTKLSEQAEQFQIGEEHYVGRRVLAFHDNDDIIFDTEIFGARFEYSQMILFRLDYDRGEVFVDPEILRPYQRPERKEEAGT